MRTVSERMMFKLILTLIIAAVALVPEAIMFGIWNLVDPVGFWQKFAMIALFASFGGGFSAFLKFLLFGLWTHMMTEL